jgi:PPOX class probable F420-dependent enzyme
MKLDDDARQLIDSSPATLTTLNRDGSPQVSLVWMVVQRTADGDDELVIAHLGEHQKVRNIRRDPRVAVTFASTDRSTSQTPICRSRVRHASMRAAHRTVERDRHGALGTGHRFSAARLTTRIPDSDHDREGWRRRALGILTQLHASQLVVKQSPTAC